MAKKNEKTAALKRLRKAREALSQLGPHHTDVESDEFLRRNKAVGDAEQALKFGKRRGWQDVDWSNTHHVLNPRHR